MASDAADQLNQAVREQDVDTALNLLEAAGGACQTRDLAKQAYARSHSSAVNFVVTDFSIALEPDSGSETLTVYKGLNDAGRQIPIASIKQSRCEKR